MVSPSAAPRGPLSVAAALPDLLRQVDALLARWRARAAAIPDPELRRQAEASLTRKRFHCEGGAVYALAAPRGADAESALRFIVALQTISDYLDNLADRSPAGGEADLALLHTAMREAVTLADPGEASGPSRSAQTDAAAATPAEPREDPGRFYLLHPHQDDGGYLAALVAASRAEVAALPAPTAGAFATEAARLVRWYCELQVRKHLPAGREGSVRRWAEGLSPLAPGLPWWEIAAATGSTLGVFALFAAARAGRLDARGAAALRTAYFPWVTGLHILLDYWIDRAEDEAGGDLNFTFCYPDAAAGASRLAVFGRRSVAAVSALPDAAFHRTVARGLPALYLADPKVAGQGMGRLALRVLRGCGPVTWLLYWAVRWMRGPGRVRPIASWQ